MLVNWSPMKKLIWFKATNSVVPPLPWKTITGNPLSFVARTAHALKSCVVGIEPVQSGSGDPSPDNVRPISGFTGANVTRTGKNLLNADDVLSNAYIDGDSRSIITISGANVWYADVPQNTQLVYSADKGNRCVIAGYKKRPSTILNSTADALILNNGSQRLTYSFNTGEYSFIAIYVNRDQANKPTWIQLEKGSTATTYEAYNGTTYSVTWNTEAGTVYGGTLDVTTGVLTVDKVLNTLKGTEGFMLSNASGPNPRRFMKALSSMSWAASADNVSGISNMLVYKRASAATDAFGVFRISQYLTIPDANSMFADATAFNTWLATQYSNGLPVTICYPLATPQTYQLTAQQVSAIVGENNMWTDCTTLTVEAKAMD